MKKSLVTGLITLGLAVMLVGCGSSGKTIIDEVSYNTDGTMVSEAKKYMDSKDLIYEEKVGIHNTVADKFLGYRAYYDIDVDDFYIYLTFDSEDELTKASKEVKKYFENKEDKDYKKSNLNNLMEAKPNNWQDIFQGASGNVYVIDYKDNKDDTFDYEAVMYCTMSDLDATREANGYVLGDLNTYIAISVKGAEGATVDSVNPMESVYAPVLETDSAATEPNIEEMSNGSEELGDYVPPIKTAFIDEVVDVDGLLVEFTEMRNGRDVILFDNATSYPFFFPNGNGWIKAVGNGKEYYPDEIQCSLKVNSGEEPYFNNYKEYFVDNTTMINPGECIYIWPNGGMVSNIMNTGIEGAYYSVLVNGYEIHFFQKEEIDEASQSSEQSLGSYVNDLHQEVMKYVDFSKIELPETEHSAFDGYIEKNPTNYEFDWSYISSGEAWDPQYMTSSKEYKDEKGNKVVVEEYTNTYYNNMPPLMKMIYYEGNDPKYIYEYAMISDDNGEIWAAEYIDALYSIAKDEKGAIDIMAVLSPDMNEASKYNFTLTPQ